MNKLFEISHKGHTNDNNGNTKQSIINAINLNYDMIEIDIQLCKTGEIILHHDIYIGDKYVYESTYDEITNIDKSIVQLHRPKRKMRQNTVMSCIFYNYVSGSLLDELLLSSYLLYL